MKVVTFETSDGRTRYYQKLVLNYLRFEDNRCLARNTLRLHCIHMKHLLDLHGAEKKALKTIEQLKAEKESVNFSSVYKKSGVSKHFLYENEEVRAAIEKERNQ